MFCITCSAGGLQSEQPCWDAGPLWSGRVQLAGSVITTLQYDLRVIKELWAAVLLQTGLLDLSNCIFVHLGLMVGGLERSALFSACKATRSAVHLLESTNLHVRGQVGIYNENFGACIDTLCVLTGREFVRASHRLLAGGVLKMDIFQFLSPQLDALFAQVSEHEGVPWVVELDGSNVLLQEAGGGCRLDRQWLGLGCTVVLHFICPPHNPDPFLVVDNWRDTKLVWSAKFARGDVNYPVEDLGHIAQCIHGVGQ